MSQSSIPTTWKNIRNLLCVRLDNMGDLLMSAPAIAALKETFRCSITVLTSRAAMTIARYIPAIDHVLAWDVPWVGSNGTSASVAELVDQLRIRNFDAAVIFTVFSQNPLPTALVLTTAGIPLRLAYCRENPYGLLSHWVPDEEPYRFILHQVRRDLALVATIGAHGTDDRIRLALPDRYRESAAEKLRAAEVNREGRWLILHPGVSERKREYPAELWIAAGQMIAEKLACRIVVTGIGKESSLAETIARGIGKTAVSLAGTLTLEEFASLIGIAPLLLSVNTGGIHIAAAMGTPTVVLYAMTNPQHAPWKNHGAVLPFSIPPRLASRNEVLRFVRKHHFGDRPRTVTPDEIFEAVQQVMDDPQRYPIPELVGGTSAYEQHLVLPGAIEPPEQ